MKSDDILKAIDDPERLVESGTAHIFGKVVIGEEEFFTQTTKIKNLLSGAALPPAEKEKSPRLHRAETLLLIVDVQEKLSPRMHEAEAFIKNCALLCRAAQVLNLPVVVTEQNPQRLGLTLPQISALVSGAPISKMLFSACTPQTLDELNKTNRKTILLCGNEAHVCVLQSALDLMEAGFAVFVAGDAISSRAPSNKQLGWERMRLAGAIPTSTESPIFELLREAGTPEFRALLPFLKG